MSKGEKIFWNAKKSSEYDHMVEIMRQDLERIMKPYCDGKKTGNIAFNNWLKEKIKQ